MNEPRVLTRAEMVNEAELMRYRANHGIQSDPQHFLWVLDSLIMTVEDQVRRNKRPWWQRLWRRRYG